MIKDIFVLKSILVCVNTKAVRMPGSFCTLRQKVKERCTLETGDDQVGSAASRVEGGVHRREGGQGRRAHCCCRSMSLRGWEGRG